MAKLIKAYLCTLVPWHLLYVCVCAHVCVCCCDEAFMDPGRALGKEHFQYASLISAEDIS